MGTRLLNKLNGQDMRNSLNEQACAVGLNIHEGGHAGSRNSETGHSIEGGGGGGGG